MLENRDSSEHLPKAEALHPGARILVVSDGADEDWRLNHGQPPLVGGVKRFVEAVVPKLRGFGYDIDFLHPYIENEWGDRQFATQGFLMYPDLEIVSTNPLEVYLWIRNKLIEEKPEAVFITTVEGILGLTTLVACASLNEQVEGGKLPYTLAYTTNFDQYLTDYIDRLTDSLIQLAPGTLYPFIRLAYQNAEHLLVPTPTMSRRLEEIGLPKTVVWPRGIDTHLFHPPETKETNPFSDHSWYRDQPLPILLYFGRLAVEKNLPVFLDISQEQLVARIGTPCHKVLIGSGPEASGLQSTYGDELIHFLGAMTQENLSRHLRHADVFVFPSLTDTFGNVILEAGASGVPTVAYAGKSPSGMEIGSQDVLVNGLNGIKVMVGDDLVKAIKGALGLDRNAIRRHIEAEYSWEKTAQILLANLKPVKWK